MFGCFMVDGNMVAGTSKRGLLVRVGKEGHAAALQRPHARTMEMGVCNDNYRERPATIRLTGGLRGAVLSELQRLPPADTGLVVGYRRQARLQLGSIAD